MGCVRSWFKPFGMPSWSCRAQNWTAFFAKYVDLVGHNDSHGCGKSDLKYNLNLDSTAVGSGRDAVFFRLLFGASRREGARPMLDTKKRKNVLYLRDLQVT